MEYKKHYKIHLKNSIENLFAKIVLEDVFNLDKKTSNSESQKTIIKFEGVINGIKGLAETSFDFGKMILLLEILTKFKSFRESPNFNQVQKILSAYDFLTVSVQPFLSRGEYQYSPGRMFQEESNIKYRFEQFLKELSTFQTPPFTRGAGGDSSFGSVVESNFTPSKGSASLMLGVSSKGSTYEKNRGFLQTFTQKLTSIFEDFQRQNFTHHRNYIFRFFKESFVVSVEDDNFDLTKKIQTLFETNPNLKLQTFLPPEEFKHFLDLTKLDKIVSKFQPEIVHEQKELGEFFTLNPDQVDLKDFFKEQYDLSQISGKPIFILTGQNSGLKDGQKILTTYFQPDEYLALGESGSLTKVGSKLTRGFVGLVLIKATDIFYLSHLSGFKSPQRIWLLCLPYFYIHKYWYKISKLYGDPDAFLYEMKNFYTKSLAGQIHQKTGVKVDFQKSYRV
jgi:hypothetical protein